MIRHLFSPINPPMDLSIRACLALALSVALVSVATTGVLAATYYVDASRPDDTGDGLTWATAKQTIQAAITASASGDTILVNYGTYALDEALLLTSTRLLTSDDGTHQAWDSAAFDATQCIVTPATPSRLLAVVGTDVAEETCFRGFTFTGGDATNASPNTKHGGGILVAGGASLSILDCWVTDNRATSSSSGYGGGIAVVGAGSSVTVAQCVVDGNIASTSWVGEGGGIYLEDGAPCQIHDCQITANVASTARIGDGGGIRTNSTDALIWANTIASNVGSSSGSAGGNGGGISVDRGIVTIWDNTITGNHAAEGGARLGNGGGIYIGGASFGDSIIVRDNPAIFGNTASLHGAGSGGGICCAGPYARIYRNVIDGNVATASTHSTDSYRVGKGGGVAMVSFSGNYLASNVISENTASLHGAGSGGGVYASTAQTVQRNIVVANTAAVEEAGYGGGCWTSSASSGVVTNNTFYANANVLTSTAGGAGSGLYHSAAGVPSIRNNIFLAHNVAGSDGIGVASGVTCTISYNCFHANTGGDYTANVTSIEEVLADPRLTDPDDGDFSLLFDSPCLEAGDPTDPVPENGGWVVDIGAIEYTGVRHQRAVFGAGELLFGGQVKAKVDVIDLGSLSEIDMVVHPGETHPLAPASVTRWYEIDHVGADMNFDLTLSYLDEELNGQVEDSLAAWRWTGTDWDGPKIPSTRNLEENWVTISGQSAFSEWILAAVGPATSVIETPVAFERFVSRPNPFRWITTISFQLTQTHRVHLEVYDLSGRVVRTLMDGSGRLGENRVTWDGRNEQGRLVPSGMYFCRLICGSSAQTRAVMITR
jgi:hypothetical protein